MREFPAEAIKQRKGAGGKWLSYIEGHSMILRMIEATENQFNTQYVDHFFQDDKFYVLLSVEVRGMGSRLGLGVANMTGGEDVLKGAVTDAFKNACKYFGPGLNLYGENYEKPVELPPRQQLSQMLGTSGIRSKSAANAAAQSRFNKDLDQLTNDEVKQWILALAEPAVV